MLILIHVSGKIKDLIYSLEILVQNLSSWVSFLLFYSVLKPMYFHCLLQIK